VRHARAHDEQLRVETRYLPVDVLDVLAIESAVTPDESQAKRPVHRTPVRDRAEAGIEASLLIRTPFSERVDRGSARGGLGAPDARRDGSDSDERARCRTQEPLASESSELAQVGYARCRSCRSAIGAVDLVSTSFPPRRRAIQSSSSGGSLSLERCGLTRHDGDGDGMLCEALCP